LAFTSCKLGREGAWLFEGGLLVAGGADIDQLANGWWLEMALLVAEGN